MNITESFHHADRYSIQDNNAARAVRECLEDYSFQITKGSASSFRKGLLEQLELTGWSGNVKLAPNTSITITSMLGDIGLCLQTGNMSRFYADLLKLEYLFRANKIKFAIYIIPCKTESKILGSNIAYFERLIEELSLFKDVINVPLYILGFRTEETYG